MVALVALALGLISRALRTLPPRDPSARTPASRLWWSLLAAVSVLALELLGSGSGLVLVGAGVAFVTMVVGLRPLLPAGTLRLARGLPSVIAVRGMLAASFFCAEAYVVYVLQEEWGLTPGRAGIALTIVGVVWAASSQAQSRLGDRVRDAQAMVFGAAVVMSGLVALALTVWLQVGGATMSAVLPVAAYVFASIGMGFAYPRTGVAMLAASGEDDRGFNSSALSIADSLGAALALSLAGVAYAAAQRTGVDPFPAVYALAVGLGVVGVAAALRAGAANQSAR
jgi:predicted MFS family arabinose efflux permease